MENILICFEHLTVMVRTFDLSAIFMGVKLKKFESKTMLNSTLKEKERNRDAYFDWIH